MCAIFLLVIVSILFYQKASSHIWQVSLLTVLLVCQKLSEQMTQSLISGWILFAVFVFFTTPFIRRKLISQYIFNWFIKIKPVMSKTEKEALEAGSVSWEGELFSGRPNFEKLLALPTSRTTQTEEDFLEQEVNELCSMLDEWDITHHRLDLPPKVWQFIKDKGFLGMIIPKKYSGKEFSASMVSKVLIKLYSKSISCATTVSVPNSLGPAELLLKYGTEKQKDYYLPRLAKGIDVPCFALTGPNAGSDASSIPDTGIICRQQFEGKEVLGIRLNWNKRYITLAPVATLLGLAFKLKDPDLLIGDKVDIGITCALIPATTEGITIGRRHFPLNTAFLNGPTQGKDVFIPLDYIIGGVDMAGQGWRMLMECLCAGRAVSLPSSSVGSIKTGAITIGAYARIRKQFNLSIGDFEGIEEPLARIAGETYILSAATTMTIASLDHGEEPAVASAILKYHTTQGARRISVDAMDIAGGKGICLGPNNFLGRAYQNAPIAVTVEGANILTRCLIIFGQGAIRCHPYVLAELESANNNNLKVFDTVFWQHVGHFLSNGVRSFLLGATDGRLVSYHKDPLKRPIQVMTRYASNLAFVADFSMIYLGSKLKFKEKLSGRLADLLSMLYLSSAVLKQFHEDGRPNEDRNLVKWAYQSLLCKFEQTICEIIANFPSRFIRLFLTIMLLPSGKRRKMPSDKLGSKVAKILTTNNSTRDRMASGIYLTQEPDNLIAKIETAFQKTIKTQTLDKTINQAVKLGQIMSENYADKVTDAIKLGLLSKQEGAEILDAEQARQDVIAVDDFSHEELHAKR